MKNQIEEIGFRTYESKRQREREKRHNAQVKCKKRNKKKVIKLNDK